MMMKNICPRCGRPVVFKKKCKYCGYNPNSKYTKVSVGNVGPTKGPYGDVLGKWAVEPHFKEVKL